jgi:hypothetical protein
MDIVIAIAVVAITCGAAYFISNKFWSTNYSRTNTSGDFGSPRGGVFASASGMLIGLLLSFHVMPLLVHNPSLVGNTAIASIILGTIAGFIPLFRKRK